MLKRVIQQYNGHASVAIYLLGDFVQDGAIDGSLLFSLFSIIGVILIGPS